MVAGSLLRDSLTSVRPAAPQPSLTSDLSDPSGNAEPGPQMVVRSRSRDPLTSAGQPVLSPTLADVPAAALSFISPRDELLPSSGSDASPRDTPIVDTPRPRTLVRTFEMPLSAYVVNSEVVPRTLGTSEADGSLQPPPRSELGAVGGPSVAPVPIVPQPGVSGLIPPAGTSAGFTDRRSVRSESEDNMQSVHSRRSERSRRSAYESGSERDFSTERADPVLTPPPSKDATFAIQSPPPWKWKKKEGGDVTESWLRQETPRSGI